MTLTNKSYAACIAGNVCFITSLFVEITEKHQMIDLIVNIVVLENIFQYSIFNNSGTAKVKIVKNERDPPLFTSKRLIKF